MIATENFTSWSQLECGYLIVKLDHSVVETERGEEKGAEQGELDHCLNKLHCKHVLKDAITDSHMFSLETGFHRSFPLACHFFRVNSYQVALARPEKAHNNEADKVHPVHTSGQVYLWRDYQRYAYNPINQDDHLQGKTVEHNVFSRDV